MQTSAKTTEPTNAKPPARSAVIALSKIAPGDRLRVGAKAAGLGKMMQAKLPVPDGFCVMSAPYRRHLEDNDVLARIEAMLAKMRHGML